MSAERHYFPGNNTPKGFYSYYRHILGQREAEKIICIKGGPGTGKSTFMKKIGERFLEAGEDVDFLHCSADENSLDGIILKNRNKAIIDGTSPHMTDPLTPGAVDRIINLGDYWNEEAIAVNKAQIIDLNEESSRWYRIAYNYLKAARSVFMSLEEVYNRAAGTGEIYAVAADVAAREYGGLSVSMLPGRQKKFFASAITANGVVNYINTLVESINNIYIVNSPEGYANSGFMEIIKEGAVYRGLDVEIFYCPMGPDEKIDHLIIPQLSLAFLTVNTYHDIEPWELISEENEQAEITLIDINDYMNRHFIDENENLTNSLKDEFEILLGRAVSALEKAKEVHLKVEDLYSCNMNFTRINALNEEIYNELNQ